MGAWRQREMLEAGSRAPDFTLEQLDGGAVVLREQLARGPVLLAFFKISCPVCQLTLPFLERIHAGQQHGSLSFFGISQNEDRSTRDFARQYRLSFPMLLDAEETGYPVSNAYGISSVPSLFLVEPDGRISWVLDGFSRKEVAALGQRAGVAPFRPEDHVPEWKSG